MPETVSLSKMQTVRKRELRKAIQRLHLLLHEFPYGTLTHYGIKQSITVLGEMRKEIDNERA
jgi:hypothetical protein